MRYLLFLLAVCGVIVSALALHVHYSTAAEICSINAKWDCGTVNHSEFAEIHLPGIAHGIAVAIIGIAGYVVLAGLALARQRLPLAILSILACAFSIHLTLIEKNVLQVWCLYCVISQTIIALITLLGLMWWLASLRRTPAPA